MSSKAPERSPIASEKSQDAAWRPRRYHWDLRHVRRGKDKKWHFPGQEADETVTKIVRKHWLFLAKPALPLIGVVIGLLLVFWGSVVLPNAGSMWPLLEIIMGLLALAAFIWFLWRDFILWWMDIDIITSKRIINWRGGFLQPSRKETPIEKVQQIAIVQKTPSQFTLNYGDVHIYLVGPAIDLKDVPNPRKVKEAIQDVTEEFKAKKPPKEKPPKVADPAVNALLEELGKPKPIPKLPDPDDQYRPLHPDRRIGPRRTFGGPLRVNIDVHYSWGEATVMYIQKSVYVLLGKIAIPVLVLLVALPFAIYVPSSRMVQGSVLALWWFMMSFLILGLLVIISLIYINYVDDVYILTNKRIIDIERQVLFFYEERTETEYKNLRDIKVKMANLIGFLLDVGNVEIETPGSAPNIVFRNVAHPFFIQDKIYELKGHKEKADEIKKDNENREELHRWFGKVIGTLEQTPQLKGAPNLQNLDLIDAIERASEFGFQVVVYDEDLSNPDIPPGHVVHQNPPPGTAINPGGEIQVILSA